MAEEVAISVLLLGDAVGKSAFIARLSLGPQSRAADALPDLRDDDQPFVFALKKPPHAETSYRLELSDTSSPTNFNLLQPAVVVLCYSTASRHSLRSVQERWKPLVESHFSTDESVPTMLLGLQRDQRRDISSIPTPELEPAPKARGGFKERDQGAVDRSVLPQEGLAIAQEMRCDRYAECSAFTGELCSQVWEDIVIMALRSYKRPGGGKSIGSSCRVM